MPPDIQRFRFALINPAYRGSRRTPELIQPRTPADLARFVTPPYA